MDDGRLWTHGWGTWYDPDEKTCLHGAIRYCQEMPGDAYLIQQVGFKHGWGIGVNDRALTWDWLFHKVPGLVTDSMLEATFGPQWQVIVAFVRRLAVLSKTELDQLRKADMRFEERSREHLGLVWANVEGGVGDNIQLHIHHSVIAANLAIEESLFMGLNFDLTHHEVDSQVYAQERQRVKDIIYRSVPALVCKHMIEDDGPITQAMYDRDIWVIKQVFDPELMLDEQHD